MGQQTPEQLGSSRRPRNRQIRAIRAGGLVLGLGLGATITLAAWNNADFAAGAFTRVGSADGQAFTDHVAGGTPGDLAFSVNAALLTPGDAVYAPFAVRLDAATTNAAAVTVGPAASTGTTTGLSYSVV